MNVYIRCILFDRRNEVETAASLPSFSTKHSTRTVYRRVLQVFWMHWRSTALIIFILLNVLFYSTLFVDVDRKVQRAMEGTEEGLENVMPFLVCLISNPDDKRACFAKGQEAILDEPTAIACLVLISVSFQMS